MEEQPTSATSKLERERSFVREEPQVVRAPRRASKPKLANPTVAWLPPAQTSQVAEEESKEKVEEKVEGGGCCSGCIVC
jgi:hypothetical protein